MDKVWSKDKQEWVETSGEEAGRSRSMHLLDATGDTKLIWNPDDDDEVEAAKAQFKALTKKNHIAFSVGKDGEKKEKISEFDADAGKMILVKMLKGG